MKIYTIWCEWDMGFRKFYRTEKAAIKAMEEADWGMCECTLEEALDEGLVAIQEEEV